MAEDWGKWQKEWDKFEPKAKRLSLAQGERLMATVTARDKLLDAHEKTFAAAVLKAWEKGVNGKALDEFLKDKSVSDAKKLLDTDRRLLVNELFEVKVYSDECDQLAKPIDKLTDAMGKAIKSTKEKSPEREKAKKLFAEIQDKLKDLHEASHLHYKLDKFLLAFNQQYDKWLAHLLAETLKKTKEKEDDDLPAPLEGKALKLAREKARDLRDAVEVPMAEAISDAKDDPKKVAALVKQAQKALSELKALRARHEGFLTKFKKEIALSKDKKEIGEAVNAIDTLFRDAEKAFKAYAAKIKG